MPKLTPKKVLLSPAQMPAYLDFGQIVVSAVVKQGDWQNGIMGDDCSGVHFTGSPRLPAFNCLAGIPMIFSGLVYFLFENRVSLRSCPGADMVSTFVEHLNLNITPNIHFEMRTIRATNS